MPISEFRKIFETNFYGSIRMIKACLPLLRSGEDSRIINLSSGMGAIEDLDRSYAAYRLSKASLNLMSILLSKEIQPMGISVYHMCPGWVKTDMGGANAERSPEEGADTAIWLATSSDAMSGHFYRDRTVIPW